MSNAETTINPEELSKFAQHARLWWDTDGPLKTLHDINGVRVDFIQQHVSLTGLNVLDVGCGGGILCEALAHEGASVIGIDAEIDTILAAQEHAKTSQLQLDYFCTSIETYEHQCFDVITCMEMLEHVDNPGLVLQHCRRLLKPGGILFLSTISRTVKAYATAILAAEYLLNLLPKQTHDYKKFIKPSELVALTRSQGFNLLDMKGMDYNPFLRKASLGTDVKVNYLLALQG